MAFDKAGLQRIGSGVKATAPTLWTYRTNDALATVDGAGYFDNGVTTNTGMREHMSVGDFIFAFATADTIATFGILAVASNASGIIDTSSPGVTFAVDSD